MKPPQEPEARGIGSCLDRPGSSTRHLLNRALRLADLESAIRGWAGEPLALSLSVANERDGTLVLYAASAAALTQLRYRQQELLQFLHQRLGLDTEKLEIKIKPTAHGGRG